MSGTTTKGLPFPTGTDRVMDGDDAIAALATALDYTHAQQLSGSAFTAATVLATYPDGLSVINMSTTNATNGGWPDGGSALIFTVKIGDRAAQWWYRNNNATSDVRYRVLGTAGNGVWIYVGTPVAAGTASLVFNNVESATVVVTLPVGRFAAAPVISLTPEGVTTFLLGVQSPSASSFTVMGRYYKSPSTITSTFPVHWTAAKP